MAQLAIEGHKERGKEVIALLEMLGGKNNPGIPYDGSDEEHYYFITKEENISNSKYAKDSTEKYIVLTLESFEVQFPHKVGDKVIIEKYKQISEILSISWWPEIMYQTSNGWYHANELKPYKEETMEEITIDIPKGYEFAGVDDDNQQVVFTKIGYHYPKTYEECCEVLDIDVSRTIGHSEDLPFYNDVTCYENNLLSSLAVLRKLLICRDAYWKIAGGWKYDVNKTEEYFYIVNKCGRIVKEHYMNFNHILAFPTSEFRDAFYENFKELIEQCKEFL